MKCTVVIPTYNRPLHLTRILSYYHQYGGDLAVMVADSSSLENKKRNAGIISSFGTGSFTHLDEFDQGIDPWHKILDAVQHVSTRYCLICADDDFVIPPAIREAADFLDANADFVSAYGNNTWFSLKYGPNGEPEFTYKYYESQANMQAEPRTRLLSKAIDSSNVTYYSLQRTEFMKLLLSEAASITEHMRSPGAFRLTPDLFFAELLILWLPSIYGKMKCLDNLYYVREDCTPQNLSRVYITLPDIMDDRSYLVKLQEFSDCLVSHLVKQSGMNVEESRRVIEKAIAIYFRRTPSFVLVVNSILNKLHLPGWLDLAIRKVYRALFRVLYPWTGSGHTLPVKYCDELDKVRILVLSSAKEIYGPGN
jgi:glycosyltransferase domain-containing protein